jgi:hypothetical protein
VKGNNSASKWVKRTVFEGKGRKGWIGLGKMERRESRMDMGEKEQSWKGKEGKDGVVEESWREEKVGWIWVKRNRVGRERKERMGWLRKGGEKRK